MEHYIFKQLRFVRENTLSQVVGMKDEESLLIPKRFNNNIKWKSPKEKLLFIILKVQY